jgi:hypothetical protein
VYEHEDGEEHPLNLRGRDLVDRYADAVGLDDPDSVQIYLGELSRRATAATVRLTWINTAVAVLALVVAVVALLK